MSVNVIGYLVVLLLFLAMVVCAIGNACLSNAFKTEYSNVTYHMADAAAAFVNGDHIDSYLAGKEKEEYAKAKKTLDAQCSKLNVSLIYVIKVDQSDYGRFESVINCVNNSVDHSTYSEWELGYQRDTTNDEYRAKYKAIYEQGSNQETIFRTHPTDGAHPHITTMVPVKACSLI